MNINNPIDKFYENFTKLKSFLLSQSQLDYFNIVENDFRKNLLISSASFIESELQRILIDFIESNSNHSAITYFMKKKAIARQYHTYFDWNGNNINSFLGLFGEEFKKEIQDKIKTKNILKNTKDFLELGKLRNELVHQNFVTYNLEKTTDEVKQLFDSANQFLIFFEKEILNKEEEIL